MGFLRFRAGGVGGMPLWAGKAPPSLTPPTCMHQRRTWCGRGMRGSWSSTSANIHTLLICGHWGWPNVTYAEVSGLVKCNSSNSGSVMGKVGSVHTL